MVQEHTETSEIKSTLEIYEINENTLKKLEESSASNIEKVFNLLKSVQETVKNESNNSPYLISISEKAVLISEMFKERQKTTEEILEELKKIVTEINTAKAEQKSIGLEKDAFSIYWILKEGKVTNPDSVARDISSVLTQYPHWKTSEEHEREGRRKIYMILLSNKIQNPKYLVEKIIQILKQGKQ